MVAAPFKGTVTISDPASGQTVATENFSATDVANAFVSFDRTGLTFVDVPGGGVITDIFLSASGTDTTQLEVWYRGRASPHVLRNAALSSAANVKRVAPIVLGPGGKLQLKQLA